MLPRAEVSSSFNSKIVKGKCKGKRKSRFRFGYTLTYAYIWTIFYSTPPITKKIRIRYDSLRMNVRRTDHINITPDKMNKFSVIFKLSFINTIFFYLPILANNSPVDYVNTLVGTQSKFELSTGNTKGAGGSFIRQRLCFRWQEYKAVWSKCQELDAIFDVLHKPEKNGKRKLW